MSTHTAIVWFRQDLRIADNPALSHAIAQGYKIIPLYILDDENAGSHAMGGASRWWLHQSLEKLNASLDRHMVFRTGKADDVLAEIVKETDAIAIFWNRCYEPWRISRDKNIKQNLKESDLEIETFNGSLLWEPWDVLKDDGTPYRVFTPYYRKGCLKTAPAEPLKKPSSIEFAQHAAAKGVLEDLALMPSINWHTDMEALWTPGEDGAHERMHEFLSDGLNGYKELRNRPDMEHVSRLSPYLHFGEVSPRQVWYAALEAQHRDALPEKDVDHFCSELGWREFSYYLLYHFPKITWDNLQTRFDDFPWNEDPDPEILKRWQKGQTGIPIVDAGMRQLYRDGWMHNRVRMIVGSFLVKNMLIHWRVGERWFWDTLVDADLASNSASWQWVAGSGADAAPYFRIFNPVTQGEKFDPDGAYVREFVPELKDFDLKYLHKPWEAPVPPGNYPSPIVDLKDSRALALKAFESTKQAS